MSDIKKDKIVEILGGFFNDIKKESKKHPLEAKRQVNTLLFSILETKGDSEKKEGYWGGSKTPQGRASLKHRLRVGSKVSEYSGEIGDSFPSERYNCRCTIYYK